MDETNPFGLFLVTSGSKGDRLLFRYPYEVPVNKSSSAESMYFSDSKVSCNHWIILCKFLKSVAEIKNTPKLYNYYYYYLTGNYLVRYKMVHQ